MVKNYFGYQTHLSCFRFGTTLDNTATNLCKNIVCPQSLPSGGLISTRLGESKPPAPCQQPVILILAVLLAVLTN